MATRRIDTKELIDSRPFGAYQFWVFLLCFLAATVDGYDVQAIGVALPGIRESLHLQPATLGIIITAGQIGVMAGAFLLGPKPRLDRTQAHADRQRLYLRAFSPC